MRDGGSMTKDQAEAHGEAMVASMHRAGKRMVAEAQRELDADIEAAEMAERSAMDQIVDFLLLDIGEVADRHALLLAKGVTPRQIMAATTLAGTERRREEFRRRRIDEMEHEVGRAGQDLDIRDGGGDGDAWAGARARETARLAGVASRKALVVDAIEIVREGLADLELPLAEAIADAREQLAERLAALDGAPLDWTAEVEVAACAAAEAEGWEGAAAAS